MDIEDQEDNMEVMKMKLFNVIIAVKIFKNVKNIPANDKFKTIRFIGNII